MSRLIWLLMLTGLFAAPGCEQKPVDRPPERVVPRDVRRDADRPVRTISAFAEPPTEEPQVKLAPRPPERTPVKVATKKSRRQGRAQEVHRQVAPKRCAAM